MRNNGSGTNRSSSGGYSSSGPPPQSNYNNGGYRGRGGGYNSRGGVQAGGYNSRGGGFQQPMGQNFTPGSMNGGFQGGPMSGIQPYNGFNNRGGVMGNMRGGNMGMRGGRGGMNNGMMGMPMGGMGMPPMGAMAMGMPQMGAGMGMQGMQYNDFLRNPAGPSQQQYFPFTRSSTPTTGSITLRNSVSYSAAGLPVPRFGNTFAWSPSRVSSSPPLPCLSASAVQPESNQDGRLKRKSSDSGPVGFQGPGAHYNPAFFPNQQGGGPAGGAVDAHYNPHGAKRTRQE